MPEILFFIFGLVIGSFLNVVSMRYGDFGNLKDSRNLYIGGRSHCPYCGKILTWRELIPVLSFIIQKGKCRSCGHKLSLQYPVVELATGIIFALLAGQIGFANSTAFINLAIWLLAAVFLILIATIDFRLFIIPDALNIGIAILGAGITFLQNDYLNHVLAAIIGMIFFGAIVLVTRGQGMGGGDIKLAGAMGLLLGLPNVVFAFMSAFIIGALWGVGLIIFRKKTLKYAVPFGPFLAIGAFLSVFLTPFFLNMVLL